MEEKLGYLQAGSRKEFIITVLKTFCQKKNIKIGYTASYMYEENKIAKQYWRILATIKNLLLINSGLPIKFWVEVMDMSNYVETGFLYNTPNI